MTQEPTFDSIYSETESATRAASAQNPISKAGSVAVPVEDDPQTVSLAVCEFIYESTEISFSAYAFWKHFVIQMIGYPLRFLAPTWSNYTAQGFGAVRSGPEVFIFLFNNVSGAMVWGAMAVYWLAPAAAKAALGGSPYQVLLFYVLHRLNIACKYASLSPDELHRFMSSESLQQATAFNMQMQLASSYIHRSDELVDFEIHAACERSGIEGCVCVSIVDPTGSDEAGNNFMHWQAFLLGQADLQGLSPARLHPSLREVLRPLKGGGYQLSLFHLVRAVVVDCDKKSTAMLPLTRLALLLSAANWLIPLVWTLVAPASPYWQLSSASPRAAAACIAYYVLSTVPSLLFFVLVFTFLNIAIADALRRRAEAATLGAFLRHSDFACGPRDVDSAASRSDSRSGGGTPSQQRQQRLAAAGERLRARVLALSQPVGSDKAELVKKRQSRFASAGLAAESSPARVPRISMSQPGSRSSLLCWLLARNVLRTFGARYKFRLDFNLSLLFACNGIFLVVMFALSTLAASGRGGVGDSFSITSPIVTQTFVVSASLLGLISLHMLHSARVNDEYLRQVGLLQAHAFELEGGVCVLKDEARRIEAEGGEGEREGEGERGGGGEGGKGERGGGGGGEAGQRGEGDEAEGRGEDGASRAALALLTRRISELEENLSALAAARDTVQLIDTLHPLKVLGFEASFGLLSAFFSISLSAVSTLAGIYISASGGGGDGGGGAR